MTIHVHGEKYMSKHGLKILLFVINLGLFGCKDLNNQASDGMFADGNPVPVENFIACTVEPLDDHYVLKCPDGTSNKVF